MLHKTCTIFIDFDKLMVENVLKPFTAVLGNNWATKDIETERAPDPNTLCLHSTS